MNQLDELKEVDVTEIVASPHQPRNAFNQEELEGLAESIRNVGLLHPPLVRKTSFGYELISGERRLRAAVLSGMKKIPVFIRKSEESYSAESALIENIQRVDLNPLEVARSLKYLMSEFSLSQEALAFKIGKKRSTLANYLRLLTLPEAIQQGVKEEKITMGHAKAVLSLEGAQKQLQLYHQIVRHQMNVREAEKAAKKSAHSKESPLKKDIFSDALAKKLSEKMQAPVSLLSRGKGGTLKIDYEDLADLDRLLEIFGIREEE